MPAPSFSWKTWLQELLSGGRAEQLLPAFCMILLCGSLICWGVSLLQYRDSHDVQRRESALSGLIARMLLLSALALTVGFVSKSGKLLPSLLILCGLAIAVAGFVMSYGETRLRMQIRLAAHVFRPRESSEWMRKLVRWVFGLFALMYAFELYLLTTWSAP